MTAALVTLDEIRAAAGRIRPPVRRTPLLEVPLGPRSEGTLFLKCENLQAGGAFKIRGACNMLALLSRDAREAGVITYSSGNHGQAVALAARRFRSRAVVVMPETAPQSKVEGTRQAGAEVIFAGTTLPERKARAEIEASVRGLAMVPPFDHPWIVAGAGTIGLELLEQCPAAEVYVPIGGGGLASGIAASIRYMRSGVRVVGVEPAGAARITASLAAGAPVSLPKTASIADGLLAMRPGDVTYAHIRAFVDDVVLVDDDAIAGAVKWLFREARLVAEPSGAASVAAALRAVEAGASGVVAIISGGNVDPDAYSGYIR